MDKKTTEAVKAAEILPPAAVATAPAPASEPQKPALTSVNVEAFARNVARMVEEGGKALAAYMKPREEGKVKDDKADDITDVVKTVGHVAEYWLSDPKRAFELQTGLGRAYLDLWATTAKRMAGEQAPPAVAADPKDKRFADPEWQQNQFFDFLRQLYLLTAQWGEKLVRDADGVDEHTKAKAAFYVKADHQRDLAVEFRADQPGTACARRCRRMPTIWCAACNSCPRTSRPARAISRSRSPMARVSRSAAISR